MPDRPLKHKEVPLTGKMITAVDPITIGDNFQSITNLRYTTNGLQAVSGMSKINATTALTAYPKIRNLYHYKKDLPPESHVLVQAYNTGLTESKIFQNNTAIPNQGDFSATALWTDSSGAGQGRFSAAPDGSIAYCNGVDTLVWGGDEHRISAFISYNPNSVFWPSENKLDWTEQVSNSSTLEVATLVSTEGGIDSTTVLLLHLNNNVTDSSATAHTLTNSNVVFDASTKVFGSHAASFNGTTAYLSIPDHSTFDFTDGTFTIDAYIYLNSLAAINPIYFQGSATDNMEFFVSTDGRLKLVVRAAEVAKVTIETPASSLTTGRWYHVAAVENGNDWYVFIEGVIRASGNDTDRTQNYSQTPYIGYNGTQYFQGLMDEFRVSNVDRWGSDFEPCVGEYAATASAYSYIGCVRPIKGFKAYVGTANSAASTMTVDYWNGTTWIAVSSLSDGTSVGGKALAQTGSVTFSDTSLVAKVRAVDQLILYWYRMVVTAPSATTSIYYVTVAEAMQTVKDLWDGEGRTVVSCLAQDATLGLIESTIQVFESDYDSANLGTYLQLADLVASTEYVLLGFSERMMGLTFAFADGKVNTLAGAILNVAYWNGASWVSLSPLQDGTKVNKSFAQTGTVIWNPPVLSSEFKQSLSNELSLYYYKINFSSALSADVRVDYITGIPAPTNILSYKFPLYANGRLFLCSKQSKDKNSVLCSAPNTSSIFNGSEVEELYFNDDTELTAGAALYSQFGSNLYNVVVLTKEHQTWLLVGSGPEDWEQFQVSETIGCVAPLTMKTTHFNVGEVANPNRNVAIWQGDNGIYVLDGREVKPIHLDIADWFDERKSYSINRTKVKDSVAFMDRQRNEYHWLFASGESTTLDKEFVYDMNKKAWFKIDRGTGKVIQCGCEISSTSGNSYSYGSLDTGYLERLENGTSMDGGAIAHELWLGDLALEQGRVSVESIARTVGLWVKAKAVTTNNIAVSHYSDGITTADGTTTLLPRRSGYSVAGKPETVGWGPAVFHGFKFTLSTSDETYGFEPLFAVIGYKPIREDKD